MPLRAVAFLACVTTAVGSPSPFLREHAKDGVAWHPWADATFDRARRDRRPLLIVIGRAPSDRCRIRLREVVTDPAVLETLERRFVPVLVDRDERPDLADAASLALGLLGANETGLPMALVLTPEARPLAGRSLAPPGAADRLRALLLRSAGDWAERRGAAEAFAGANAAALREAQAPAPGRAPLAREVVDRALRGLAESFDAKHGGFGVAPKAIPHGALRLLLAEHARTGRPETLRPAVVTLLAMAGGALRGHPGRQRAAAAGVHAGPRSHGRGAPPRGRPRHRRLGARVDARFRGRLPGRDLARPGGGRGPRSARLRRGQRPGDRRPGDVGGAARPPGRPRGRPGRRVGRPRSPRTRDVAAPLRARGLGSRVGLPRGLRRPGRGPAGPRRGDARGAMAARGPGPGRRRPGALLGSRGARLFRYGRRPGPVARPHAQRLRWGPALRQRSLRLRPAPAQI